MYEPTTCFYIQYLLTSFSLPVTQEIEPRKCCEVEGGHTRKRHSLFCLRVHERKPLPDDEGQVSKNILSVIRRKYIDNFLAPGAVMFRVFVFPKRSHRCKHGHKALHTPKGTCPA